MTTQFILATAQSKLIELLEKKPLTIGQIRKTYGWTKEQANAALNINDIRLENGKYTAKKEMRHTRDLREIAEKRRQNALSFINPPQKERTDWDNNN